ncbi:ribbon-helix-helix domain-containing protein, partial [Arenibaculum sp.]|uniref:ribbon-helix-helix domain-containing protein n=1 Tax=Arenibaculum sp. TaxID=2865862 RepID=UPI002E0E7CDA|nr:ribbon-helix-helix domain-containing protein [Arenibaculum sp.]
MTTKRGAPTDPNARITRNVVIRGRRTSIRLESAFWELVESVSRAEGLKVGDLLSEIDGRRGPLNLAAATRLFVASYVRDMPPRQARS